MQKLKAGELFNSTESIDRIDFDGVDSIDIDFSNVDSIDLKSVCVLLDIQKVAILNSKKLTLCNMKPSVKQILDIIGLSKTFNLGSKTELSQNSDKINHLIKV